MTRSTTFRALATAAVAAALTLGVVGAASAQDQPPAGLNAQICAAATIADINALLTANLDVQLPAGVRDAVDPRRAAGTLDQVKAAAGCTTDTPDPTPTATPDPTGPDEPFYPDCAAAVAAGAAPINSGNDEPGYRPELDADGDGIACEAGETGPGTPAPTTGPTDRAGGDQTGAGGFTQLDDVPSGAAETGGGPA